jgi:hypothetical protein
VVVDVVGTGAGTIQLAAGLAPHLGQEPARRRRESGTQETQPTASCTAQAGGGTHQG